MAAPQQADVVPFPLGARSGGSTRGTAFDAATTSPSLDELSLRFAMWAGKSTRPCLDVGCGSGVAASSALLRGATVLALDPDPDALHQLLARVPVRQFARLATRVGSLPDADFKPAQFGTIHVARVLQVLDGEAIRNSLECFSRWLAPHGRLFLSVFSPRGRYWQPFWLEYQARVTANLEWPGHIADVSEFLRSAASDRSYHLLDEYILRRELEHAGFTIDEMYGYSLPWDPWQVCCGAIAQRSA